VRKDLWSSDASVGLAFSLVFFALAWVFAADSFRGLETAAYDLGVRGAAAAPNDRIAVIEIDDYSIERLGRWPWSRKRHAEMVERLQQAGAKVIALSVFFSEPQQDAGALHLQDLAAFYDGSNLGAFAPKPALVPTAAPTAVPTESAEPPATPVTAIVDPSAVAPASAATPAAVPPEAAPARVLPEIPAPLRTDLLELRHRLDEAERDTNADRILAERMKATGSVLLPMVMQLGVPKGNPDQTPPEYVLRNALFDVQDGADGAVPPLPTVALIPPIAELGEVAAGIGHLNALPDVDGAVRAEALVLEHHGAYFPSLALAIAARSLNIKPEEIRVTLGEGVQLGGISIGTTPQLEMYNFFYPDAPERRAFRTDPYYDVISGSVRAEDFKDKIVIIGASAAGVGDTFATPVSPSMSPVQTLAHTVSAILEAHFFTRPAWADLAESAIAALLVAYLCLVVPRLSPTLAAAATLSLVGTLVLVELALMSSQRMWLQLMTPAAFLLAGHLLITVKRFNLTEKLKLATEAEGAESNKMLGLSYQGQGQLDMAFEKFRKLEKTPATLDLLYNLALDFERKRQHNKAHAVYQDIVATDPAFRDAATRLKRAKQLEDTVMLGGGGGTNASTLLLDSGDVQKPMLGRYEVEKELGKGAMGVVYLGKDPKINRVVAIKTMALGQEFEADELAEAKARFFREAETAGRLNHKNIVTIYDAGEEHDLCYIAMEFLKGKDLTRYAKAAALLPADKVFEVVAQAAEALDYAHQAGIVHRDIKPANLMYEDDTGQLKLTDFGIARITDSSRTKTGMVLGTPSYMSPEQLSGKKVDGRSDLFSLGVTYFQLLTGQLPFQGDSMATLMYKIANDQHPPLGVLRPDLPPCTEAIMDKILAKDPETRYQRGSELADDIRRCAASLPKT
jgi:serine/threonine-protein kinase